MTWLHLVAAFLTAAAISGIVTAALAGPRRRQGLFHGPLLPPETLMALWLYTVAMTPPGGDGGPGSEPSGAPGPAPSHAPGGALPAGTQDSASGGAPPGVTPCLNPWHDAPLAARHGACIDCLAQLDTQPGVIQLPVRAQVLTVPPWYDAYLWADDPPQLVCPDCDELSPELADIPAAVAWIARHDRECNA